MQSSQQWQLPVPGAKLSVIMPAYRLAASIGANIETVCNLLDSRLDYEVVVVDDCSGDGTAEAIASSVAKRPGIVVGVYQPVNRGKGEALREGFKHSTGDYVLLLDGDLDLSPAMLPQTGMKRFVFGHPPAVDLDGKPRIFGDRMDNGCYELPFLPGTLFIIK